MSASRHEAWMGINVDHLYPDCPSTPQPPRKCRGFVDPLGTDLCGVCVHRWKRTRTPCADGCAPGECRGNRKGGDGCRAVPPFGEEA